MKSIYLQAKHARLFTLYLEHEFILLFMGLLLNLNRSYRECNFCTYFHVYRMTISENFKEAHCTVDSNSCLRFNAYFCYCISFGIKYLLCETHRWGRSKGTIRFWCTIMRYLKYFEISNFSYAFASLHVLVLFRYDLFC